MREATCAACQTRVPMNEAFTTAGRQLCGRCLEQFLSEGAGSVPAAAISRMVDPTVCARCEADHGNDELPTVAGVPACPTCTEFFRNRPFPAWLKVSFVALLCVAVAAFAYNWRFFMAYVELLEGNRALDNGDIVAGASLLGSAADRVPEIPELTVIPNLLGARALLSENKNREALALLQKSAPYAPPELQDSYRQGRLLAEMGIAFDAKDYDTLLAKSQEIAALAPDSALSEGAMASAYACKYATTGEPEFRQQSLEHVERAKTLAGPDNQDFADYENRILHRLETREIISGDEFRQRFPNGWHAEEGP